MPFEETKKRRACSWYYSTERRRFNAKKKTDAGVSFFTASPQMGKKETLLSGNAVRRKSVCEENIRFFITEYGI